MFPKGSFIFRRLGAKLQANFLARKLKTLQKENVLLRKKYLETTGSTDSVTYYDLLVANNARIKSIKEKLLVKE